MALYRFSVIDFLYHFTDTSISDLSRLIVTFIVASGSKSEKTKTRQNSWLHLELILCDVNDSIRLTQKNNLTPYHSNNETSS